MAWADGNVVESFVYNPNAAPVETSYTLVGTSSLCGTEWKVDDANNDLTLGEDGVYSITVENVAAGEHKFKVARNHSWANAWPSSDYVLTLTEESNVTVTFNPDTEELKVTSTPVGTTPDDGETGEGNDPVDPPVVDPVCTHENIEVLGASDATCKFDGYTGDVWCKDCKELITEGKTIPASSAHAFGEWELSEDGRTYVQHCSVCGATEGEAKGHALVEATCEEPKHCENCRYEEGKFRICYRTVQ